MDAQFKHETKKIHDQVLALLMESGLSSKIVHEPRSPYLFASKNCIVGSDDLSTVTLLIDALREECAENKEDTLVIGNIKVTLFDMYYDSLEGYVCDYKVRFSLCWVKP
jgi:hypothetical protein